MKKLIFTLLTALTLVVSGCKTDEPEIPGDEPEISMDNFPDPVFRNYVLRNFDTDNDGVISTAEALEVTEIWVNGYGIKSLEGIQYFINLKELWCPRNQLSTLDVSKNTALESLYCNNNQLSTLDVSKTRISGGFEGYYLLHCNMETLATLKVKTTQSIYGVTESRTPACIHPNTQIVKVY